MFKSVWNVTYIIDILHVHPGNQVKVDLHNVDPKSFIKMLGTANN